MAPSARFPDGGSSTEQTPVTSYPASKAQTTSPPVEKTRRLENEHRPIERAPRARAFSPLAKHHRANVQFLLSEGGVSSGVTPSQRPVEFLEILEEGRLGKYTVKGERQFARGATSVHHTNSSRDLTNQTVDIAARICSFDDEGLVSRSLVIISSSQEKRERERERDGYARAARRFNIPSFLDFLRVFPLYRARRGARWSSRDSETMERSKSTSPSPPPCPWFRDGAAQTRDESWNRERNARLPRNSRVQHDGKENAETRGCRNVGDDEVVVYTLYRMHEIFGSRESPLLRHGEDTPRVSVEAYILYGYGWQRATETAIYPRAATRLTSC